MSTRILAAADGTRESFAALCVANRLALRNDWPLEVLAVLEPSELPEISWYPVGAGLLGFMEQEQEALRARVERQFARLGPGRVTPRLVVEMGSAPWSIAARAQEDGAGIIVTGRGRHGTMDRLLGGDTAREVVRLSRVPVLSVAPGMLELPRRAVVAVDFSEFSHDAARSAAQLLVDGGELHLVHVAWAVEGMDRPAEPESWRTTYRAGVDARLGELERELGKDGRLRISTRVIGATEIAPELLRITEELHADLLAAGSHGRSFFTRLLGGSVSNRLIKGANCSVLIAPPRSHSAELRQAQEARAESGTEKRRIQVPALAGEPAHDDQAAPAAVQA